MNQIPHTITAPQSHRPNPAQVMREAIMNENTRRQQRRDRWLAAAIHAFYFVAVVLGTIAVAIN